MIRILLVFLAASLGAGLPLSAQGIIVVSGGGAALQQAIDAASPGDTLDVRAASYDPILVQKGIRILCRAGVVVTPAGQLPSARIERIPAGERCELRGGTFQPASTLMVPSLRVADTVGTVVLRGPVAATGVFVYPSFALERCQGPVLFDGAEVGVQNSRQFAFIRDCDQVTFSACTVHDTVNVEASDVAFTDTELRWGLRVDGGQVSVADGLIQGPFQFSGIGDPGVILESGELVLAGDVEVRAISAWTVEAIRTRGGLLRIGPRVRLIPPIAITGPAIVLRQHVPSVHAAGVPSGQPLPIRVAGLPGSLTATLVDVPRPPVSTAFGALWLSPTSPVLDLRTLDPSGTFTVTPAAVVPPGTALTLQPLSLTPGGTLLLGTPARLFVD